MTVWSTEKTDDVFVSIRWRRRWRLIVRVFWARELRLCFRIRSLNSLLWRLSSLYTSSTRLFCKCWFKTPAKTVLVSRLYLIQICTTNLVLRCRQDRSGGIDTELGADGELHTVGAGTTETSTSPANIEMWDLKPETGPTRRCDPEPLTDARQILTLCSDNTV